MTAALDQRMRLIIVTGLSGSGKSVAIRQLEDSGFYCIDNLPLDFIDPIARHLQNHGQQRVAIAVDVRSQRSADSVDAQLSELKIDNIDTRILFLTASTPELVKRFSETRRRHPLTIPMDGSSPNLTLSEAIAKEREMLASIAPISHVIDTTDVLPNTLRDWVRNFAGAPEAMMTLAFESFAFKRGIPVAADLVFDVRNLPNPYYDPKLRPLTGKDEPVKDFFAQYPDVNNMIADIEGFIRRWLPSYEAQNRHYLTVEIGCTGGQHRSVFVAEELARRFKDVAGIVLRHRQLARLRALGRLPQEKAKAS